MASTPRKVHSVNSAFSTTLDQPPSCMEFSAVESAFFVVGTYHLESPHPDSPQDRAGGGDGSTMSQARSGSLVLFRLDDDTLRAVKVQTVPTVSAVLDLHFSPHNPTTFAIATSTGAISLYSLTVSHPASSLAPSITHTHTSQLFPETSLVLALVFHPSDPSYVVVSLSTGDLALANPQDDTIAYIIPAHSDEAWTVAFSPTAQHLYSGGDDSALVQHTLAVRSGEIRTEEGPPTESWVDRRTHGAGVTAILSLPAVAEDEEQIILTGSYDEFVRVYDCRARQVLAETRIEGGGVWRLKVIPSHGHAKGFWVLASCMHAGSRVLDVLRAKEGRWTIEVLEAIEEHQSMNYAGDTRPRHSPVGGGTIVVSTSFYDRLICVWTFGARAGLEPGAGAGVS